MTLLTKATTLNGSETLNTIRSGGRGSLTKKHSWDVIQLNPAAEFGNQPRTQNRVYDAQGQSPTLLAQDSESKAPEITIQPILTIESQIRRLTEIECERLQGLPDNWTKYGMYHDKQGKLVKRAISSTQRYSFAETA